ncbi:DNA cytosine methyltransferase [Nocardioidaceae bacterium SCSIO 66511]|nr:DNA cytosine methyltransferase [Nocardioidaceae bacterium SCSIO 66511]
MNGATVVDLFAGPGGWDEGMRLAGCTSVTGIDVDEAACATARAAGHARVCADVAATDPCEYAGVYGLVASPPCQAWSPAGLRRGEDDRTNCHTLADRMADGDDSTAWTAWADPRSALVCQPIRWIRELRPAVVGLEEVPPVRGLWEHFARILSGWGYTTWVGVINAADYGVPQTRKRAILLARSDRLVLPPEPTHSRDGDDGDLFGGARMPWVSMAAALGWGIDDQPSCTVSSGGTQTGGAEPFANARYRHKLATHMAAAGSTGLATPKDAEAGPADTVTGKGTAVWLPTRPSDGDWFRHRPATTVVGSYSPDVIAPPGYRTRTSRQNADGGVRVSVVEAGVLQGFRPDYPWQGSRTKQYEQVGNAIPPPLAAHLATALGLGIGLDDTQHVTTKEAA